MLGVYFSGFYVYQALYVAVISSYNYGSIFLKIGINYLFDARVNRFTALNGSL